MRGGKMNQSTYIFLCVCFYEPNPDLSKHIASCANMRNQDEEMPTEYINLTLHVQPLNKTISPPSQMSSLSFNGKKNNYNLHQAFPNLAHSCRV